MSLRGTSVEHMSTLLEHKLCLKLREWAKAMHTVRFLISIHKFLLFLNVELCVSLFFEGEVAHYEACDLMI